MEPPLLQGRRFDPWGGAIWLARPLQGRVLASVLAISVAKSTVWLILLKPA